MTNNIAISLGFNCDSATYGIKNGLRRSKKDGYNTCPFDKMLTNYEGVIKCIEDDFQYFCDDTYLKLEYLVEHPTDLEIRNTKYNFLFNHESPGHANLYLTENWPEGINHFVNNQFKNFKIRYQKRINNFRNYLSDPNNIITFIITTWNKTDADLTRLSDVLKLKYPHLSYNFKILNCTRGSGKNFFLDVLRMMKVDENDEEIQRLIRD
jgi:hypothetical protein